MQFRRTSECRVRSCPIGLRDGVSMNSLNRQRVMSHLVSQVPSAHAYSVGLSTSLTDDVGGQMP